MSASHTTQQSLLHEVEAMVAALMGDALPAEIRSIAERLEAAADHGGDIPTAAVEEVHSAIKLVRNGQPCAAVSALLSARLELGAPPR
ncbi:MAG TPA: hypothetical protein VE673_01445 [Pseudonocardiaceae bacterium]|nr:hypothetical protein [Pseudonocardiaceae bacterium]